MEQRGHAWIAARAIALLEDEDKESALVKLIRPYVREAVIGAWIPDKADAKRTGNRTDNHIFKITKLDKKLDRFVASRAEMIKRLGPHRKMTAILESARQPLDDLWWKGSYKADTSAPGKHTPNRANGLATTLKDLLIMGDKKVDKLVPGDVRFIKDVDTAARTHAEAAALYMTMLSHFVADSCMPCHCDARNAGDYGYPRNKAKEMKQMRGTTLHEGWERFWRKMIGTAFDQKKLVASKQTSKQVLDAARAVDAKFDIAFKTPIPELKSNTDVWLDTVNVCRASFAIASIVCPPETCKYNKAGQHVSFEEAFANRQSLLQELNRVILHDAVLNTAIVWKHIWQKVSKE
jgi:hypothetical protein